MTTGGHSFRLDIITMSGVAYSDDAVSITAPTQSGVITVLAHHEPLVTLVRPGEAVVVGQGKRRVFKIGKGVAEVRPHNRVVLLVESAAQVS